MISSSSSSSSSDDDNNDEKDKKDGNDETAETAEKNEENATVQTEGFLIIFCILNSQLNYVLIFFLKIL